MSAVSPALRIQNLSVSYAMGRARLGVVHDVSLNVPQGSVTALVGESGSGKSTIAQSIIGLLPGSGRIEAGRIDFAGTDLTGLPEKGLRALRGARISLIPQDPTMSLNPLKTVGAQVAELFQIHARGLNKKEIADKTIDLLARVGLPRPKEHFGQYPHELSGGMKQRVLIAAAVALGPDLIIADEPTSALDVTVQKRILDLIDNLRRENNTSILLVTHDLGVAADRSDQIIVLNKGRVEEAGATGTVLANPQSAYARRLIADNPSHLATARPAIIRRGDVLVSVTDLVHEHKGKNGSRLRAVDHLSLSVERGSTHAIVGESGSGKTTAIRNIVGLVRPTSGQIIVDGRDIWAMGREEMRQFRRRAQLVYQNPYSSLDPRQAIRSIIAEPLANFGIGNARTRRIEADRLLERVGLASSLGDRVPAMLSGGQRQRVAIARALVLNPELLVLDEAVSALDVTVQTQILSLLAELQQERQMTYIFVTHDLAVVRQIADTVSVMHSARQVEVGNTDDIFERPTNDYTKALIQAIPGAGSAVMAVS